MKTLFAKVVISLLIVFAILSQSLIYDSGLCYMRKFRQICTCNHNSKKEVHSQVSKSDCHDSTKVTHICSCKKNKNPNELSNLIKQTFFLSEIQNTLFIHLTKYILPTPNLISNLKGYRLILIKPPRLRQV
jgi:hypothetical protein